jgi:hypothetical protein
VKISTYILVKIGLVGLAGDLMHIVLLIESSVHTLSAMVIMSDRSLMLSKASETRCFSACVYAYMCTCMCLCMCVCVCVCVLHRRVKARA